MKIRTLVERIQMTPLMKYKSTVNYFNYSCSKILLSQVFIFFSSSNHLPWMYFFSHSLSSCISQTADMSLNYFSCPLRVQEFHCSIKTLRNSAQHSNTFMYLLHVQKVMYSVTQNEIIKNNSFLIMIDYQYSNCKIVGTYLWIAYLACCCDYSPILTETAVCRNCLLPWVYEWT